MATMVICERWVSVPADILESLISMAENYVEDITSGIEEGIYNAEDNKGLSDMQKDIEKATQHLKEQDQSFNDRASRQETTVL